jgi:hypothetical protein
MKLWTAITKTVGREDIKKADSPSTKMALALARKPGHVYEGTVPAAVIARRRVKGKAARLARRAARR